MIKFEIHLERSPGIDICRAIQYKFDEAPYLKGVFFFCGVSQQLCNLGILDETEAPGLISNELTSCWHRLMDSGYRPDDTDIEIFSTISLSSDDMTQPRLDEFLFWYNKFISPDFFKEIGNLRLHECNQAI